MFWFFECEACGILALWPGVEPLLPVCKGKVSTTGLPGKSLCQISFQRWIYIQLLTSPVSPLCTKFLWQDRTLIENKIWFRSLKKTIAVSEPFVHAKISLAAPKFYSLSQKSTYFHRSKVTLGLGLLFYKFDFFKNSLVSPVLAKGLKCLFYKNKILKEEWNNII